MRTSYLFLATFLLTACSGGGGGEAGNPLPVTAEIVTAALEPGNVGLTYSQNLRATGGEGAFTWWVSSSGQSLPPGLALTADGHLTGTPSTAATRSVVVVAQAANQELATRTMLIETRDIRISGSNAGNVDPGTALNLSASGGNSTYSFSLNVNGSGAAVSPSGSYTAGSGDGVDVVRATDVDGFYDEITVVVGEDPFIGFIAQWGTSDVWHIYWDAVYDPTPTYASDLDEVLVALGFRDAATTGSNGSAAENLARALVIRRTLGHLSTYYGNKFDGAPSENGLRISFVKPSGPATGTTPSVGDFEGAAPFSYNTICVRSADTGATVGTAWLDNNNSRVEHNCGDPSADLSLGVFVNRLLPPYRSSFGNGLANNPIDDDDADALQSLLTGHSPSGTREIAIYRAADDFARVLAAVLAHEIGHSLGLDHAPATATTGDLMAPALTLGSSVQYSFSPDDWTRLAINLPGNNR